MESFLLAFATLGYETCATAELEAGFEKVALYVDETGEPTHAARQVESGAWSSKIGEWEDIEHNTLRAMEGPAYGRAAQFLKRPRH